MALLIDFDIYFLATVVNDSIYVLWSWSLSFPVAFMIRHQVIMLPHQMTMQGLNPISNLNANSPMIDQITQIMKSKVKEASEDGKFTSAEIVTLTMASVHATEQLFPYLKGTEKQVIAAQVITTVIHQLVAEGVLNPELGAVLEALPVQQIIDAMVILMNQIGGWFHRHWPAMKLWLQTRLCCCCFPSIARSPISPPLAKSKYKNHSSHGLDSVELQRVNAILAPISVTSLPLNAHSK